MEESPEPGPNPDPVPDPDPLPDPTPSEIPFSELRGVNFIDRLLDRNEGGRRLPIKLGYVDEFVAKADELGFNVLRIPVTWESYVDNKDNFLKELDYLVKTVHDHEPYVWIVFFQYDASSHWPWKVSPFGGGFPKDVVSCYHPTKDYERDPEIREFWDDYYSNKVRDSSNSCKRTLDVWTLEAGFMEDIINVVDKYPNLIGYELINEPHVWKDSHYDRLGELHTWLGKDLRSAGVDIVTIGQYLQPTSRHLPVKEYAAPEKFNWYKENVERLGFVYVVAGPLVRSSYRAGELFIENFLRRRRPRT